MYTFRSAQSDLDAILGRVFLGGGILDYLGFHVLGFFRPKVVLELVLEIALVDDDVVVFCLGRGIAMMKPEEKWGQGFYDTLSRDLRESLPDAKGFSIRNLQCMRQIFELFPSLQITQQAVAQNKSGEVLGENEIMQQAVAQNGSEIAPQLVAQIVSIPWGHIRLIGRWA